MRLLCYDIRVLEVSNLFSTKDICHQDTTILYLHFSPFPKEPLFNHFPYQTICILPLPFLFHPFLLYLPLSSSPRSPSFSHFLLDCILLRCGFNLCWAGAIFKINLSFVIFKNVRCSWVRKVYPFGYRFSCANQSCNIIKCHKGRQCSSPTQISQLG